MTSKSRKSSKQLRVIHAPAAVAGNSVQLSKTLNEMGYNSICLTFEQNQYCSPHDLVVWNQSNGLVSREIKRLLTVLHHSFTHDVYIFNYGSTLSFPSTKYVTRTPLSKFFSKLHMWWTDLLQITELSIILLRRAKVVVVCQGDDVRQGDVQLSNFEESIAHHSDSDYYTRDSDNRKRKLINRLRRFGVQLVALNPDLLPLLGEDAQFVPYGHIDLKVWSTTPLQSFSPPLVVGHFPSNARIKGTQALIETIDALTKSNVKIELRLISGVSQDVVADEIRKCHIIVDQLYAGFYGGLAVEAMALGRPVVAYLRREDFRTLDVQYVREIPLVSSDVASLGETLTHLTQLTEKDVSDWSERSRQFVEKWHNPEIVAIKLMELARPLSFPGFAKAKTF